MERDPDHRRRVCACWRASGDCSVYSDGRVYVLSRVHVYWCFVKLLRRLCLRVDGPVADGSFRHARLEKLRAERVLVDAALQPLKRKATKSVSRERCADAKRTTGPQPLAAGEAEWMRSRSHVGLREALTLVQGDSNERVCSEGAWVLWGPPPFEWACRSMDAVVGRVGWRLRDELPRQLNRVLVDGCARRKQRQETGTERRFSRPRLQAELLPLRVQHAAQRPARSASTHDGGDSGAVCERPRPFCRTCLDSTRRRNVRPRSPLHATERRSSHRTRPLLRSGRGKGEQGRSEQSHPSGAFAGSVGPRMEPRKSAHLSLFASNCQPHARSWSSELGAWRMCFASRVRRVAACSRGCSQNRCEHGSTKGLEAMCGRAASKARIESKHSDRSHNKRNGCEHINVPSASTSTAAWAWHASSRYSPGAARKHVLAQRILACDQRHSSRNRSIAAFCSQQQNNVRTKAQTAVRTKARTTVHTRAPLRLSRPRERGVQRRCEVPHTRAPTA
eukprot:6214498-Pleurochrysis_carterae.AAC.8